MSILIKGAAASLYYATKRSSSSNVTKKAPASVSSAITRTATNAVATARKAATYTKNTKSAATYSKQPTTSYVAKTASATIKSTTNQNRYTNTTVSAYAARQASYVSRNVPTVANTVQPVKNTQSTMSVPTATTAVKNTVATAASTGVTSVATSQKPASGTTTPASLSVSKPTIKSSVATTAKTGMALATLVSSAATAKKTSQTATKAAVTGVEKAIYVPAKTINQSTKVLVNASSISVNNSNEKKSICAQNMVKSGLSAIENKKRLQTLNTSLSALTSTIFSANIAKASKISQTENNSPFTSHWMKSVDEMGQWYVNNVTTYCDTDADTLSKTTDFTPEKRRPYVCDLEGNMYGISIGDDCSSYLSACLIHAGYFEADNTVIWFNSADYLPGLESVGGSDAVPYMEEAGFVWYDKDELDPEMLQAGDILVRNGHVEVFSHFDVVENRVQEFAYTWGSIYKQEPYVKNASIDDIFNETYECYYEGIWRLENETN